MNIGTPIDLKISFDTTGSMYPCLTQVRERVERLVRELFTASSNLRISILAHGDYCDRGSSYVIKVLPLTNDAVAIVDFVRKVGQTNGGDTPECYELVLRTARVDTSWRPDATKVLVIIGDDVPHSAHYPGNIDHIDWRTELKACLNEGISVYGVHAMPGIRRHSKPFYMEIARITGGSYTPLDQFSYIHEVIKAITYKQVGPEQFEQYTQDLRDSGADRNLQNAIAMLRRSAEEILKSFEEAGATDSWDADHAYEYASRSRARTIRTPGAEVAKEGLHPVPAGRFQVMRVSADMQIRHFVEAQGIDFKPGRGFYLLEGQKKSPKIQQYKELVLVDKETGDVFNGAEVRKILGLSPQVDSGGVTERLKPQSLDKYRVFVQSTSYNRKLIAGTDFLYEVPDWDRTE